MLPSRSNLALTCANDHGGLSGHPALSSSIKPPVWGRCRAGLQFGLQFTSVRRRSQRTDHRRWSSLNQSEQPRPELLMRLGARDRRRSRGEEASERRTATKRGCRAIGVPVSSVERSTTVPGGRQHGQVRATNRLTVSSLQARGHRFEPCCAHQPKRPPGSHESGY
jgi:hypothetical protein